MTGYRSDYKKFFSVVYLLVAMTTILCVGCKKFIEVDSPINNISVDNVYTSDVAAASVVTGIYQTMSRQNSDEYASTGLLANIYTGTSLSADELTLFDINSLELRLYYTNNLISTNAPRYWSNIYSNIYTTNAVIEGVGESSTLTSAVKQQLLGEAKFLRAFNFFYLTNFYGDVPMALSTDYKANTLLTRAPQSKVYEQIIADLKEAETLLSEKYLQGDAGTPYAPGSEERVRPTKWAAAALLSRVYLYTKDYSDAEVEATSVINNTSSYELTALDGTFLKNSQEAIWQLMPVNNGINANTGEGKFFILPSDGPGTANPVYLSEALMNSFEANDQRKVHWVNQVAVGNTIYSYPFKYKAGVESTNSSEYSTILRLAEVYLNRAEARAQLNRLSEAAGDLNMVRKRAGLADKNIGNQQELLNVIYKERRVELFTEWGHRWFDLKRTGNADKVLSVVKGSNWQTTDQLYPIPYTELIRSPNMKNSQNAGY